MTELHPRIFKVAAQLNTYAALWNIGMSFNSPGENQVMPPASYEAA